MRSQRPVVDFLGNAVENPVRPFVAILGGAKVADKLNVISNLLEKCDTLIIGGGMAYTFLKAKGYEIGKSLVDESKIDYCKEMMEKAEKLGKKLLLPVDSVMIDDFPNPIDAPVETEIFDADKMSADKEGCDIGPKTIKLYADAVKTAKTVVWNGPMGVFENPTLAAGTKAVAAALAETDATSPGLYDPDLPVHWPLPGHPTHRQHLLCHAGPPGGHRGRAAAGILGGVHDEYAFFDAPCPDFICP